MDKDIARKICELLAGILVADGQLHPTESALFDRVLKALGMVEGPGAEIAPTLTGEAAAQAMAELPKAARLDALDLLIDGAIVDGKVLPSEQEYLSAVASALGMGVDELDERVADRLLDAEPAM